MNNINPKALFLVIGLGCIFGSIFGFSGGLIAAGVAAVICSLI